MNLEIGVNIYRDKLFFHLVNELGSLYTNPLFSASDIPFIRSTKWFLPLLRHDLNKLLVRISDNQLMVALYFYLQDYSTSKELMLQWFLDAGCSLIEGKNLAELVSLAHLEKMETGLDIPDSKHFFSTVRTEPIYLSSLFELVSREQPIHWIFDSLPVIDKAGYLKINLKQLSESGFMIEDHSCIIIGFSCDFTSFLELISGYKAILMSQLCKLVPLDLRDIYSVGRLFIENPYFIKLIINAGLKDVEFYGLDATGRLTQFQELMLIQYNTGKSDLHDTFAENNQKNLIPLYAKFLK